MCQEGSSGFNLLPASRPREKEARREVSLGPPQPLLNGRRADPAPPTRVTHERLLRQLRDDGRRVYLRHPHPGPAGDRDVRPRLPA